MKTLLGWYWRYPETKKLYKEEIKEYLKINDFKEIYGDKVQEVINNSA